MNVAVVSTAAIATPPSGYGGIEKLVYLLVKQLEKRHNVSLFAAADSYEPNGGLYVGGTEIELARSLYEVIKDRSKIYDVVIDWSHMKHATTYLQLRDFRKRPKTINMVFWTDMLGYGYNVFPSNAVKRGYLQINPELNQDGKVALIPPGIDVERYPRVKDKEDYFLYFGRIIPEKGVKELIHIANALGIELIVAGHIGQFSYDKKYVEDVKSLCTGRIHFLGDVDEKQKIDLIAHAAAVMHRPNWLESFWIVGCEALACGTPLIVSLDSGGPAEQVVHGKTGFICSTLKDWQEAVSSIRNINPDECIRRAHYFSDERMGFDWLNLISHVVREIT